jgi:hypothetical protein
LVVGKEIAQRVVHKDIHLAELSLDVGEHAVDILRARNVCLDEAPIGPARFDLRQGIVGSIFVLSIVDGDPDTLRC